MGVTLNELAESARQRVEALIREQRRLAEEVRELAALPLAEGDEGVRGEFRHAYRRVVDALNHQLELLAPPPDEDEEPERRGLYLIRGSK